ncbi:MAG: hypothetical protein K5669_06070, partial [Lachnospiraceae bacterium]|nr:hypothetical protein [Lachnospiraceae bacterium]
MKTVKLYVPIVLPDFLGDMPPEHQKKAKAFLAFEKVIVVPNPEDAKGIIVNWDANNLWGNHLPEGLVLCGSFATLWYRSTKGYPSHNLYISDIDVDDAYRHIVSTCQEMLFEFLNHLVAIRKSNDRLGSTCFGFSSYVFIEECRILQKRVGRLYTFLSSFGY